MANINDIINVQLLKDQSLAQSDNMNIVTIMTTDRTVLNSNNRYKIYGDIGEVTTDFGSASDVTAFAQIFFAQTPNPISAGGALVIGYWRASSEDVAATHGYLVGGAINVLDVVPALQQFLAASLTITIDGGTAQVLTGLDFSSINDMADAAVILDTAITGATVAYSDTTQQLTITSATTGATSTVSLVTGTGDEFVGALMGLVAGSGAIATAGVAAQTLTAETEQAALAAVKALIDFKGFMFMDQSISSQRIIIAQWAQANFTIGYDVFSDPANLTRNITNSPAWAIKLQGLDAYRMIYSRANNRQLATAYMSRAHVVNFNADNTTLTMNLKQLNGCSPETYNTSDTQAAYTIGLDIYTTIKDVPCVICSIGNDFVDNIYNLTAYISEVQTDAFNLLRQTPTKIPQTTPGVDQLVNTISKTTVRFINAGAFAPGTWTSSTFFGNLNTFLRAITQQGYYILAGLLSAQKQADRQARKSPPIQVAVKNAGAIHRADILINFNY